MKLKKLIGVVTAAVVTVTAWYFPIISHTGHEMTVSGANYNSRDINALDYTYEVIPLLEPFNEYFYVKTDNPDPETFRFSDKDSPYSETSVIEVADSDFADVVYEDTKYSRVDGGYIFYSGTTNGGELTLQIHKDITEAEFNLEVYGTENPEFGGYSPYPGIPVDCYEIPDEGNTYMIAGYFRWTDSNVKVKLGKLCDEVDYLIDEYAKGTDFFENMNLIQSGLSSICHYSGSYIRGDIYREDGENWRLYPAGHRDQVFYIYSPYSRKDNKSLLASALYPYRYDSLGFPALMGAVSKRLSSESTYEWDDYNHNIINVTYNNKTESFGGQGSVEGKGISTDKLTKIFDFSKPIETMTLTQVGDILKGYAKTEMTDDIPRDGQLTWEKIYDTVGDGDWADMGGIYTYLYQADDELRFSADEWGVGNSIYWGGSLGYCSDMWVDGRYISDREYYIPGETFEKHPTSDILIKEIELPVVKDYTRKWNSATQSYVYESAEMSTEIFKNVVYKYDEDEKIWKAADSNYNMIKKLTESGVIEEKYIDILEMTYDEVTELGVDKNTNQPPEYSYSFDGTHEFGEWIKTPEYETGDANHDGKLNVRDAAHIAKMLAQGKASELPAEADFNGDGKTNVRDAAAIAKYLAEGKK